MTTSRILTTHEYQRLANAKRKPRLRPRTRAWNGPIPTGEGDYAWTADHLIDDPREPTITPIGILDARGFNLLRVTVPIKVKLGFAIPGLQEEPDEVERIVPEDMLAVSDIGQGISHITPEEVDFGDDEDDGDFEGEVIEGPEGEAMIKLSDVLRTLSEQGLTIIDDVGLS